MFNKTLFNKTLFNKVLPPLSNFVIVELLGQYELVLNLLGKQNTYDFLYGKTHLIHSLTGKRILLYNLYGNNLNAMLEGEINKLKELLGQYIQGDDLDGEN